MDIPFIKTSIIHKTIGSININHKLHNKKYEIYTDIHAIHIIALFLKDIFIKLTKIIYNNNPNNSLINSINSQELIPSIDNITNDQDNINSEQEPLQYHLEYTMLLLHSILYRIVIEGFENWLEIILDNFVDFNLDDIYEYPKQVNIIRIRLELFLYSQKLYNDFIKAKHISTALLDEYIDTLDNDDNLNEYMDYTQSIRNHYHFKALKDKLSSYNK
jgi:hypothetical protein